MLVNKTYRIYRIDKLNIGVEQYREITNPFTKTTRADWVDSGKFFYNVKDAIRYIEQNILFEGSYKCEDLEDFKNFCNSFKVVISIDEEQQGEVEEEE